MDSAAYIPLLENICRRFGWVLGSDKGDTVVTVTLQDGGTQPVYVYDLKDASGQVLIRYVTPICAQNKIGHTDALRLNNDLPYGALAIRDDKVVLTGTSILRDANPSEVGSIMSNLAYYASYYRQHYDR